MQAIDKHTLLQHKLVTMFPDDNTRKDAVAILHQYGTEKQERESERVWLAILKISGTNLEKIRQNTALAKQDYRDTLVAAEYPNQGRCGKMPEGIEKEKLIEKDRLQYEKWLFDG